MTEAPWYTARSFIASVALLALILVTALVSFVLDSGDGQVDELKRTVATDKSWGSRCGLPHGSQAPVVGPPNATWKLIGHIPAPAIEGVGPGNEDGVERNCYQHSPLGALLAAANFLPVTLASTDHDAGMDHYAPGKLRDLYERQPSVPVPPNTTVQTVGFKMLIGGRDQVDVTLALRVNGALGYIVLPMRWTQPRGDWRLVLQSAQAPLDVGLLDSLTGYIPWSA